MKAPITPAQAWAAIAESSGWDVATKLERSQAERIAELERESETHSKAYGLAIVERDNLRHELKTAQEGWRCECSTDDACRFARERDALRAELAESISNHEACKSANTMLLDELATIAATEPYAYEFGNSLWHADNQRITTAEKMGKPLFTHPMPAQDVTELVEALEMALKLNSFREFNDHIPAMRTALSKCKGAK